MDWVETTGKSVDEATDRALAHLGIHRDDAEVEVLEEPKTGLFGRIRGEARVRARVRPAAPRPKRSRRSGSREKSPERDRPASKSKGPGKSKDSKKSASMESLVTSETSSNSEVRAPKPAGKKEHATKGKPPHSVTGNKSKSESKESTMSESVSLSEQGEIAKRFLDGFVEALGVEATSTISLLDDETVEVSIDATPPTQLGILVGPRGVTLQALQEVTRTYVQSKVEGRTDRILVDVARYRERRVAALGRFAAQVADEVLESGEERALEPMSPADRKAVHDALSGRGDVVTRSEGEEPRRFVVISLA